MIIVGSPRVIEEHTKTSYTVTHNGEIWHEVKNTTKKDYIKLPVLLPAGDNKLRIRKHFDGEYKETILDLPFTHTESTANTCNGEETLTSVIDDDVTVTIKSSMINIVGGTLFCRLINDGVITDVTSTTGIITFNKELYNLKDSYSTLTWYRDTNGNDTLMEYNYGPTNIDDKKLIIYQDPVIAGEDVKVVAPNGIREDLLVLELDGEVIESEEFMLDSDGNYSVTLKGSLFTAGNNLVISYIHGGKFSYSLSVIGAYDLIDLKDYIVSNEIVQMPDNYIDFNCREYESDTNTYINFKTKQRMIFNNGNFEIERPLTQIEIDNLTKDCDIFSHNYDGTYGVKNINTLKVFNTGGDLKHSINNSDIYTYTGNSFYSKNKRYYYKDGTHEEMDWNVVGRPTYTRNGHIHIYNEDTDYINLYNNVTKKLMYIGDRNSDLREIFMTVTSLRGDVLLFTNTDIYLLDINIGAYTHLIRLSDYITNYIRLVNVIFIKTEVGSIYKITL